MRYLNLVLFSALCAGCQSNPPVVSTDVDSRVELFQSIAPIADADPSIRHIVEVNVPTIMRVVSRGTSVTVSFSTLRPMNLTVGDRMETGISYKQTLHLDGVERFLSRSLHGGLAFKSGEIVLTPGRDGVPEPGQEFILEQQVTMFETGIPTQHMWSPKMGKHYRVLWTQTFRQTIK
ncbi:MAG: hypothetical protein AAEJ65_07840 [Planctomycetota bacterium]